jgi:hypothetical protein
MGWSGLTNGTLLEKAQQEFDVFLTGDQNLTFQQPTSRFELGVVVLHAESIQLRHTPFNAEGSRCAADAQVWPSSQSF